MQTTATDAKNRFGYFCAQAKNEPVIVEKDGRPDTVLLDFEEYKALKEAAQKKSLAERKKEFDETYKDWIAEQHALVEKYGIPGEEFRTW
ncbi:type II toxin-antitoxin system Phd/YefM family antitoxin [Ramlibacter sp.]|uniref:type II toxin-antitoxin system Phd/YefM family antitoxin n=1 Tax=Ramlibacter sp. TaxID=1917967 RepID=UPI001848D318|nr:type II toxin-antitoxin system Phd/YefM family antitoxin [Ramlibacter sp.]MBA2673303.1 type II toxin-antitoxin system Phd/YefM family antitoxin [Ramlibacter sp.]